ncbi:MAG TPA: T9SS type A sorting domain-containing protein [Bacteroidota bacterium]|nr:T9SS type A sorting domain-containing protein [Bacteroidota bacterium]
MTTDKPVYGYGETIKLSGIATNPSDTTVRILGPYTGFFMPLSFNEINFTLIVVPTDLQYEFPPKSSMRWEYQLNPARFGLPNRDGTHKLYGRFTEGPKLDSISISAPAYYGGQLRVGFTTSTPDSVIRQLRDSMNAIVLSSHRTEDRISEQWQTTGFIIDSLLAKYRNDARFMWIEPNRILYLAERIVTSMHDPMEQRVEFRLSQNYPNPFNPATVISFTLPDVGTRHDVSLRVFNMLGQEVATLVNGEMEAGYHQVQWQAEGLPSGVYFYRLEAGSFVETKKMMLVR